MIISKYIPFSYLWIHKYPIPNNIKTVLDIGCGNGEFMSDLSYGENWEIVGVDINRASIKKAKSKKVYKRLIVGDVVKVLTKMVRGREVYDVVISSQLIEHLTRSEGIELLKLMEKLARRIVMVGTPRGFMKQPIKYEENKKHQEHKSGWNINDFIKRKYVVRGVGFIPAWSFSGLARDKNSVVSFVFRVISLIFSPYVYYFPNLGSGIVAYKKL